MVLHSRNFHSNNKPFKDLWFENCFNELYTPLCQFCYKLVYDPDLAEDIVQQQYVYLWEHRERLKRIDSIKSYLYTAVKNKSLSFLQSKYAKILKEEISEKVFSGQSISPQEQLEAKELEEILDRAIQQLPEKCRTVFIMRRFGSLSHKEIAAKLNISVKTVEHHMNVALKRLSELVESEWCTLISLASFITLISFS